MAVLRAGLLIVFAALAFAAPRGGVVPDLGSDAHAALGDYGVLGQPSLFDTAQATRCPDPNARFSFLDDEGFEMFGPSGIAVDHRGRLFVTDFGGKRVLTWPDVNSLELCDAADAVIGAGALEGPEAVVVDPRSGTVFVADTLAHAVRGYKKKAAGWTEVVTLGTEFTAGDGANQFNFPRGMAVGPEGRLFVADDFNNRVAIFDPPFTSGEEFADSIGAGANGGFDHPKGLAMVGHTLFVADYEKNRVLRFTGPFNTPDEVYTATGEFTGLNKPVDVAMHPDGRLLVTDQGNVRISVYHDAAWTTATAAPSVTFNDHMNAEPLGVATDYTGRIFIADYRAFRVLIRDASVMTAPASVPSTAAARTLLREFHSRVNRVTDRVSLGQQMITWEYGPKSSTTAWYGDWLQLKQQGLPLPEIMGGEMTDLISYPGFVPNRNALNEMIRHGKSGHPVTINWHPSPPAGGGFGTPAPTQTFIDMTNDATATGKNWQTQLNRAAKVLRRFKQAGVPVIFRPLHEQNGNFFWWGDNGTNGADKRARQEAWVKMWRDMVTELTDKKGLTNLLFVFGVNQVDYDGVTAPMSYYPGGDWVDMVSIDVYNDRLNFAGGQRGVQHYAALVNTGKPFGIAEFGQGFDRSVTPAAKNWDARTLARRVRDSFPRTVFAISWYSSIEGGNNNIFALPDVAFTKQLLNDTLIDTQ